MVLWGFKTLYSFFAFSFFDVFVFAGNIPKIRSPQNFVITKIQVEF